MRVILPITIDNWKLALKCLSWATKLGELKTHSLVLSYDRQLPHDALAVLTQTARTVCPRVELFSSSATGYIGLWQEAAATCFEPHFLWLGIPLRPHWLDDIETAWNSRPQGKTIVGFASHGHLDPASVYSSPIPAVIEKNWHAANGTFQWQGLKPKPLNFTSWQEVSEIIDFSCAIFHGNDPNGTLIDRMIEARAERENSTEVNVPQHAMEYYEPPLEKPPGRVGILIVTFAKDFDWLAYCLRSLKKFATGFEHITVAMPEDDRHAFMSIPEAEGIGMFAYKDVPGKGFLMHAYQIGRADIICPDVDYILHLDADCMAKESVDAGHFFEQGKPVLVYRSYASLTDKTTKVVSDCARWQQCAEDTIGQEIDAYTMCRHGSIYPKDLYPKFRSQVALIHGHFRDHVLAQKNSFPMTYAEFPAMGGFAYNNMRERFHWVNAEHKAPRDKIKSYWSHSPKRLDQPIGTDFFDGFPKHPGAVATRTARMEIEEILNK